MQKQTGARSCNSTDRDGKDSPSQDGGEHDKGFNIINAHQASAIQIPEKPADHVARPHRPTYPASSTKQRVAASSDSSSSMSALMFLLHHTFFGGIHSQADEGITDRTIDHQEQDGTRMLSVDHKPPEAKKNNDTGNREKMAHHVRRTWQFNIHDSPRRHSARSATVILAQPARRGQQNEANKKSRHIQNSVSN